MNNQSAATPEINAFEFEFISEYVESHAGIALEKGKEYLAARNLHNVCREEGIGSVKELVWRLKNNGNNPDLNRKIIQSMTINETLFFRDGHPFDDLKTRVLPQIIEQHKNDKKLSIWSCSCSTGQEPYSIALILRQYFQLNEWELNFNATDIDDAALEKAREGIYNTMEVSRGMPEAMRDRYMKKEGLKYQFKPEIRSMIQFKTANLVGSWPFTTKFDLVLLRNTLIYFKPETKISIIKKIHRFMNKGGYLMLSAADIFRETEIPFRQETVGKSVFYRPL